MEMSKRLYAGDVSHANGMAVRKRQRVSHNRWGDGAEAEMEAGWYPAEDDTKYDRKVIERERDAGQPHGGGHRR